MFRIPDLQRLGAPSLVRQEYCPSVAPIYAGATDLRTIFGSGVSARFHPAKHNGLSDGARVLALGRFPLARSPSTALRVQAFVPCIPPISLLTLSVGGVTRPCYAGTGKRDSLEEFSSVVAFLSAGTRLACRT